MKKKLFLLLPALGLLFGMSACDNGPMGKTSGNTSRTSHTSSSTSNSSGNTGSSSEEGGSSSQAGGSSEEGGGSSQEGGSSEEKVVTPFTFKIGEGDEINFGVNPDEETPQGYKAQYTVPFGAVTAGQQIRFFYNSDEITVHAGVNEASNNVSYNLSTKEMRVVMAAQEPTCYFKIGNDDGYSVWLTGNTSGEGGGDFDPTPVTTGFGLSVNGVDVPGTKTEEQSEGRDQYLVAGLELKTNDVVKVRNLENEDAWAPEVEEASFGGDVSSYLTVTESQYTVKQDCKVDVYIKIKGESASNDAVYFGLAEAEKEFSYQIGTGSKVTFGEEEKDDEPPTGYKAQYTLSVGNVTKDTLINFFDGENALEVHAGVDQVDNNVSYNLDTKELKVVMDANEVTCYFKIGNDNGYSIWLTGNTSGEGGGDFDPTPVTTGFGLSVNGVDVPGTKTEEQSEGRDQYFIDDLELKTGDVIKVRNLENEDAWAPDVEDASFNNNVASYLTITTDQYTVKQDCTVDVYIKIKGESASNDAVYFGLPKVYSYQINTGTPVVIPESAKSDLVDDKDVKYGVQYKIGDDDLQLKKGDIIKFYENDTPFYPHAWGEGNNGVYDETTQLISVHNDVNTGTIYLKWYDDNPGNPDVWVTGYVANTTTIYCKMEYDWWTVDGAAVGIYYWGEGSTPVAWPGVRMNPVTGHPNVWSFELDIELYPSVIFTRVNGSGDVSDWGAKTEDLVIPTDGKNLFTITTSTAIWGDPGCSGEWSVFNA
ncbi:MAG: hypothetical protein IJK27_01035 [Bacilli bacterium]|nr:hypothetical protein [Bacilli bacterium]